MTRRSPVAAALDEVTRPLRGATRRARLASGLALAVVLVAGATWLVRAGAPLAPLGVLVVWVLMLGALGGGWWIARRSLRRIAPGTMSAELERAGKWRRGALTTLLDASAEGTSLALQAHAAQSRSEEIRSRAPALLWERVERERRTSRGAMTAMAGATVLLVVARPVTGAPAPLWHPLTALRALAAPVTLTARHATVRRGERATFDIGVAGHRTATLATRAPGEAWHLSEVRLDAAGHATVVSAPLESDLIAQVRAGGRESGAVRVGVQLPAFLGSFTATAHYPAYLGLEDESLPTTGDTLVIPEGTRLTLAGAATTPLAAASLSDGAHRQSLPVRGMAFAGDIVPATSGTWTLGVTTVDGVPLQGDGPAFPIRLVADSAPVVEVPVPGTDTLTTTAPSLTLVVSIHDDHGIATAAIETRRNADRPGVPLVVPLPPGTSDRALVTLALNLTALGLHPGDTLRYAAIARDNAPSHHLGRSREYLVRVPTVPEQRTARLQQTANAASAFDSVSRQAARVQRTEEDLSRERPRVDGATDPLGSGADGRQTLSNESARKAAVAAQAQQQLLDDAGKLQRNVQQLRDQSASQGAADSSITRQLDEINRLLDKALSPELRQALSQLQQAIKNLDANQTQQSLQGLAQRQAQLKEAMDQARALFQRAALETSLTSLAQSAHQLADEQHQLTPQLGSDSGRASQAERGLAARTDSLASSLERLAPQVPSAASRDGVQQSAQQAHDAAATMRQSAQSSDAGKPRDAAAAGKKAEDELTPLSKKISEDTQAMQAEMRAEVKQALERALQETAALAQRQLALANRVAAGDLSAANRLEQGVVEESAGKLAAQVSAVAAMNALVSPQAGVALAQARQSMRDAVAGMSSVSGNARVVSDKAGEAVDALAVAAYALLQSKDKVNGSQSGSGVQEAMQEMQKMAGKQGQLADQGSSMMQQGGMSAQQLMAMAMQQRALAQQLERMRSGGLMPGAGQLSDEARELARTLESGRLNQDVVQRQQKLFKRMLDAGRMLQGEEDDEKQERQSTTAHEAPPAVPPALDPRIRNGTGEIRVPSWESLQHLSAEDRRRVLDYFQRLSQRPRP